MEEKRDCYLLRLYVEERSEEAFAVLGRRYAGLIYATCLRETGDRTLAEDAAQGVFLLLSQKARALRRYDTLAGWLYSASRYIAKNLLKKERRRTMYEARAQAETRSEIADDNRLWEHIEPHFYEALNRLKPSDREAILLRFVQEQSLDEVGASLGISENTARMRIQRALEKIRLHLGSVGIAVSIGALTLLLEERPAQALPQNLLDGLSHIARNGASLVNSTSLSNVLRQASLRSRLSASRLFFATAIGVLFLLGFVGVRLTRPERLSPAAQRRLFAQMAGSWTGKLEYADDRSHKRYTYTTAVLFRLLDQGDTLQYVSTYAGSASVDTTTLKRDRLTNQVSIENGGEQSSHTLSSVGELVRLFDGRYAFQGNDRVRRRESRLLFTLDRDRLTMQEEFRLPGQQAYQFRNRFTLTRQ